MNTGTGNVDKQEKQTTRARVPGAVATFAPLVGKFADANIEGLHYLMDSLSKSRLEIGQMSFLLSIAKAGAEGINMSDLTEQLGVDPSFVSRNAGVFGLPKMTNPLVEKSIDYTNPKSRLLKLTAHGEELLGTYVAVSCGIARYNHIRKDVEPNWKPQPCLLCDS
ncbi:MarR family winged helix-turn-helix transcriptional regulator [Congregibacter variabilis]|uniref:MarR family winged helix-turn-helix transcriptional regulator n=1 Tax=Congregibacter variabilis TaxID=3081200 RepID=A0ABZ0I2F7_9GAMM|nr:MarR family winged helix-turn-helix transcriptional regulator [Congregibacter sp. IMCC43200]